ncbi:putative toxin-antitoxin system, antitoxin component [delta proteobacterium NaphS2]|nr:putative toxin-antitoxin system, antitoxin component [delta proteobacterium NaphS2]
MGKKFARITVNPEIMNGQPCIRNMRLTVRRVVEAVALYPDWNELQREYPELEKDDIREALQFAAGNLYDQTIALEAA